MMITGSDFTREYIVYIIDGEEHLKVGDRYYEIQYMKEHLDVDTLGEIYDEIASWSVADRVVNEEKA